MNEILKLSMPISWLDGIDPRTGVIIQPNHPEKGESIAGKILILPHSTGSTVGAYTFFKLVKVGKQPKKIILERPDSVTISAELAGIPVEVTMVREVHKLEVDAPEKFLRFLEKEASISGSKGFIKVNSVHISGVSYSTIGDAGLEFLEEVSREGLLVKVKSTTNPTGMDLRRWKEMGIQESYAEKQFRIVRALLSIGVEPTFTCIPYLVGNRPKKGEHVCWGESSAVAFVNSVLGAKTNREGGVKTIVAAVVGFTPKYGMHLKENRRPNLLVKLEVPLQGRTDFGVLAYYVGSLAPKSVPRYEGISKASEAELKSMGAAGAASGSIELFHIDGITPEASLLCKEGCETLRIGVNELKETKEWLSNSGSVPDIVAIGCPHLSRDELVKAAELLDGRKVRIPFWLFTSREILEKNKSLCRRIEKSGAKVLCDTCMVVCPLKDLGYNVVATDSAKAARYLHTFQGLEVVFEGFESLVSLYATRS